MNDRVRIVMAEDDPDDRLLAEDALREARLVNELDLVENGEELLDYLLRRGAYSHLAEAPLPGLILLDLNMPRMDGREALAQIKEQPHLRRIPVVVLTTSKGEEDVLRTYELGASSYITKPVTFESLVQIMRDLGRYWFEIVRLPHKPEEEGDD